MCERERGGGGGVHVVEWHNKQQKGTLFTNAPVHVEHYCGGSQCVCVE